MAEQENNNKSGSKTALIIIIIAVVLIGGGGALYWFKIKPDMEAKEKARLEQIAKEKAEKEAAEREAQKQAQYDELIADGDVKFDQEDWEGAKPSYTQASDLYPDQAYPQDQLAIVNAKLDSIAIEMAKPKIGAIEMLRTATGRFYVVLSSSIDDDLAMDYAKKLSTEGININILECHAPNLVYFAVSPANFDTYEEAETALEEYASYGEGHWVLRY